jgi:hypothetical protein
MTNDPPPYELVVRGCTIHAGRYRWDIRQSDTPLQSSIESFASAREAHADGQQVLEKLMQVASGRLRDSERTHKFEVGQSVSLRSTLHNRDAASGAYKVTKQLPAREGEFEYQIKRPGEPRERVVKERDLSSA